MQRNMLVVSAASACLTLLVVSAGCKTAASAPAIKATSATCPGCNLPTTIADIKRVAYVKGICPECRKATTISPAVEHALRNYVGDEVGDMVHVCTPCKTVVERCPACRRKAGM
jgi:hypothetical protein